MKYPLTPVFIDATKNNVYVQLQATLRAAKGIKKKKHDKHVVFGSDILSKALTRIKGFKRRHLGVV